RDVGRRPRGVLPVRGERRRAHRDRDLRLPESVGSPVRGASRTRLPAHEHPARRRRGRAAGPRLPAARGPRAFRIAGRRRARGPLRRRFPPRHGVRVRAGGRALRAGPVPARRGGPADARAGRGDAPHLRAAAPSRDVPAVRRLRGEGAAHASREGGARDGRLGAAASHLPLPAHGMSALPPHVAVVGGGFAGLAAAIRLARGGARVTLLERRPFLGGRAYSFTDPATGDVIDNGPHALMGAYTAALDFLGEIGAASKLAFPPRLHVPLSELYTADAQRALERAGGTVVTGAAVATLALDPGGVEAVVLRDGTRVEADAVVLAVPVAALLRLLPPALRHVEPFRALAGV